MRVLFILISSQYGLFWYDFVYSDRCWKRFYSKSTALFTLMEGEWDLLWEDSIVYSGLRSCRPVWLLSPGFRFSCRCRYLQMNPLDRLSPFKRPVLAFRSRTIRTADSPAGPHRANAYANAERGLHNTDNLSESPKQSHPENGLLCFPARNQRNGPGAFTWGSVVERWRWRGSGSLCPSHNNNPGRTASSHCEHEDGLEAVIPLVGARGNSHFTPDDGRKRFGAETLLGAHKRIHTDTLSLSQNKMPTGSTAAGMTPSIGAEPTSSDPPTSAACSPPLPSFLHPPLPILSSIILHSVFFSRLSSSLLIHAFAF